MPIFPYAQDLKKSGAKTTHTIKVPGDYWCSGISKRSGHLGAKILPIGSSAPRSLDTDEIRESFSWRIKSLDMLKHWLYFGQPT